MNQIINDNNQTVPTKSVLESNNDYSFEMRPLTTTNNTNKNEAFYFQSLTNLTPKTNQQSKMIVNLSKCNANVIADTASSESQSITTLQQITNAIQLQSPVREILNPTANVAQHPTIIHIPCNIATASSNSKSTSILSTFIQPTDTVSSSTGQQIYETKKSDNSQATINSNIVTTTRKRRINEFDTVVVKTNDGQTALESPLQKITRLNDSTSKFKTTLKKSKETFKSIDNLENIDLSVNKCTINVLDDETVKTLSKGKINNRNYALYL